MTGPRTSLARFSELARKLDAATPPHRDRVVDALRALAVAGVIIGHWLVTALVATGHGTGSGSGSALHDASHLATLPVLTPLSWVFQTLAIFFLVGGFSAAKSYRASPEGRPPGAPRGTNYRAWLTKRLTRLSRPVAVLAVIWTFAVTALFAAGVPWPTLRVLITLVLDPLWFLGVFALLTAATPVAVGLVRRFGAAAATIPVATVAVIDLVRFGLGDLAWLGWINVLAGWLVPYLLGIAWARGSFAGWKTPALMLGGGVAATAALIGWAGYPASMVGVNGAAISNLNPPTLAVVTFGIAQAGLALLLRGPLARWTRRPLAWAAIAVANLSAMTLFLWHQTAFITVNLLGALVGRLPGLQTAPASLTWIIERLAWLPAFAIVLGLLWATFRRAEQPGRASAGKRTPGPASESEAKAIANISN